MAGVNKIDLAKKHLKDLDGNTYHALTLKSIIKVRLASEESRAMSYIRCLCEAGVFEEVRPFMFKVDLSKIKTPEEFEEEEVKKDRDLNDNFNKQTE